MWGCMSAAGVGELHFIDGIMNSQMYCSILKEKMLTSLRRCALFQHDNDPKHLHLHLADTFIQSDLQCIQVIHFLSVHVFPGNQTHNLCTANAML